MIGTVPKSLPGKALLGVRLGLGTSSWLTPKFVMVCMGLDPHANPHAAYMTRLFGIRDLTLGIGLLSTRGDARRLWWRLGMLCDLADSVGGVISARRGEIPSQDRLPVPFVSIAGAGGVSLGAAALISGDV